MTTDKSGKEKDGGQTQTTGSDQTSAAQQVTSQIEVGRQYSGETVLKVIQDALSADGREQKSRAEKAEAELKRLASEHQGLVGQFNTASGQLQELVNAREEAEEAVIKDDPAALTSLRARRQNRVEAIRLESLNKQLTAMQEGFNQKEQSLKQQEASINIKLAAMSAGVAEKELADLVPDGNPERLAKAAKILKTGGSTQETDKTKTKPAGLVQSPASAISSGGDARSVSAKMLETAKARAGVK